MDETLPLGYRYVLYGNVPSLFSKKDGNSVIPYEVGQPVWVLRSSGRRNKNETEESTDQRLELYEPGTVIASEQQDVSRSQLSTDDDRLLVEYPRKSTYRVLRNHLTPVLGYQKLLDESNNSNETIVVVCCETSQYRKACVVHAHTHDIFVEIGCDYGTTCERVRRCYDSEKLQVIGLDKSKESIDIAEGRRGNRDINYALFDILSADAKPTTPGILPENSTKAREGNGSTVIAVDINGNRELDAVLACLKNITDWFTVGHEPRLVICKSRALHNRLCGDKNRPRNLKETEAS